MSDILTVSAINYCQHLKLTEIDDAVIHSLPISSYKLKDGTHQIISRYNDDEWRLEDARFPSNRPNNKKIIRFDRIPSQFTEAAKFAFKNYDITANPSGASLMQFFNCIKPFLAYLDKLKIECPSKITPLVCASYVQECKLLKLDMTKKPLSKGTLVNRFLAIERIYNLLKRTQWSFKHPWPESSATYLAGNHSVGKKVAKTQVIPDEQLQTLITYCNEVLEQAPDLIKLKKEIEAERIKLKNRLKRAENIATAISNTLLKPKGYAGLNGFNKLYNEIPTAIAIIILTFSGIRCHELCDIQNDAYRIQDDEDEIYYYLKSHSSKTYEGYTEWLVPEIVIDAIKIQQAYIKPLQDELIAEQQVLLTNDNSDHRGLAINQFKSHLFLTRTLAKNSQINPLSAYAFARSLDSFGKKLGIEKLAPHRFRRSFAVHVAQSAYGDLRYLKEHFKHWSMDMTLLYAANDKQEEELYNEIAMEVKNHKISVVRGFLEDDAIIAGGLANKLIAYRSNDEAVKTFKSRQEMAEKISDSVHIRSTGHSWCTSDSSGCGGRSVIESTRCVTCKDSIIEKKRHSEYYKVIYLQQLELRKLDDIGPVGKQRVERDIVRCESVLKQLGMWDIVKAEAKGAGL